MSEIAEPATQPIARKRPLRRMLTMAGWPFAYVLGKLGTELRRLYMPFINEPLPDRLRRLAERLLRGKPRQHDGMAEAVALVSLLDTAATIALRGAAPMAISGPWLPTT